MAVVIGATIATGVADAAPPEPSGPHPRLFLDETTLASLRVAATRPDSAVNRAVAKCNRIVANPAAFDSGGWQGLNFADSFGACALSWVTTQDTAHGAEAVRYFRVLLDDFRTVGDGAGGDDVVRHDTGYAMRSFAPYAAIAYDWLYDAPGVDEVLRAKARQRFKAWTDWYDAGGYHNHAPGANYHAGYVFGATLIAVAQASEAGAESAELWAHVVDNLFLRDMATAMLPGGLLDGGDWLEGWQYGPLAVAEYAVSARALQEQGVRLVGFAAWAKQLLVRAMYASTPGGGDAFIGGDSDVYTPHLKLGALTLYAMIIVGDSQVRAWAQHVIDTRGLSESAFLLFPALAEVVAESSQPFPEDSPTWYYSTGSMTLYARTGWAADDIWFVTKCTPGGTVADHGFYDAGNFVMSRGQDHVIVDPSSYGTMSTLSGNAPTVASTTLPPGYEPGQSGWARPDEVRFAWKRQTQSGVIGTRCEYAGQYRFRDTPSSVRRAVRDLILVPTANGKDATLIAIDNVDNGAGPLDVRFRTLAALSDNRGRAGGALGSSRLTIQRAASSGGTGEIRDLVVGSCYGDVMYTRGDCDVARIAGDEWRLSIPGPRSRVVSVVDAASGTPPAATVTNTGGVEVLGAERGGRWLAVVSTTEPSDGNVAGAQTYRTRGGMDATHVVIDAPRGSAGRSDVTARMINGDCEVTVTARDATGGFSGSPLVLLVSPTCLFDEDADVEPYDAAPDPTLDPLPPLSFGADAGVEPDWEDGQGVAETFFTGCGCRSSHPGGFAWVLLIVAMGVGRRYRRGPRPRF